jgi:type IV secretory pathway VirB4 component
MIYNVVNAFDFKSVFFKQLFFLQKKGDIKYLSLNQSIEFIALMIRQMQYICIEDHLESESMSVITHFYTLAPFLVLQRFMPD